MNVDTRKRHTNAATSFPVAAKAGNWPADVTAYDHVHAEILSMSAMLANGIISQFPNRF